MKRFQQQMIQQKTSIERGIAEMDAFEIDRHRVTVQRQDVFRTPVTVYQADTPSAAMVNQHLEMPGQIRVKHRQATIVWVEAQFVEDRHVAETAGQGVRLPGLPNQRP